MTADKILKTATKQIGVKENPINSNNVKYNTEYYGRTVVGSAYPWCCVFVWWVFKECGASNLFYNGEKTAYCPTVETYYKRNKQWYSNGVPGDLVLFDFSGKGVANHIGIVEKVNADGTYTCIEGNTSTTSNDNGGCVMRRVRSKSSIRGFARPRYTNTLEANQNTNTSKINSSQEVSTVNITMSVLKKGAKGNQVKTLQRLLVAFGFDVGSSGIDGDFGTATHMAVKKFQAKNKLSADGIVGANTWNKLLK